MTRHGRLIVERLGARNAQRLAALAGGTRLTVPARITAPTTGGRNGFERLAQLLGHDLAVLVVLHFGDSRLYVPNGKPAAPVDRRTVIRLTRKGWSASRIARKLGCSDRTVHKHRAPNGAQPEEL